MTFPFKLPRRNTFSTNQEADLEARVPNLPSMTPQIVFGKRDQVAFGVKVTERLMVRRKKQLKHKHGRWSTFEAKQFLHCIHEHGHDNLGNLRNREEMAGKS